MFLDVDKKRQKLIFLNVYEQYNVFTLILEAFSLYIQVTSMLLCIGATLVVEGAFRRCQKSYALSSPFSIERMKPISVSHEQRGITAVLSWF